MKSKKKTILLILGAVLLAVAAYSFTLPRPVIEDPESAVINAILIERHPHYQEDESDHFVWRPETEEDLAVAQEILDYLRPVTGEIGQNTPIDRLSD